MAARAVEGSGHGGAWHGGGGGGGGTLWAWAAGALTGSLATALYFVWQRAREAKAQRTLAADGAEPSLRDVSARRRSTVLSTEAASVVEQLESQFHVSPAQLYSIMRQFVIEMEQGLTEVGSSMKMIPSFVDRRPTGNETGSFLALDLGGTNFRVVQVNLEGRGRYRTAQKKFTVSDEVKTGTAKQLFDFLAACIVDFLKSNKLPTDATHHLGFTFSFPVQQTGLASGTLLNWTKGFSATGVEGEDVVRLLSESLKTKGVDVRVSVLANDTVGTLVTQAYSDADCYVGVILGTGSNAAYVERASAIPKWRHPDVTGEMIINMEWGGFDSADRKILPLTAYDRQLDRESVHPTEQIYEKLISGMYLGEITRIVLTRLVVDGAIYSGTTSRQLETPYAFDTSLMSRIERDHSAELSDVRNVLEELMGVPKTTHEDRMITKRVCELVGLRAARLAAAGIAGVITKINKTTGCTVAVDGSVFEHYPHFSSRMRDALQELFGVSADNIRLASTHDGSGVGAGLLALIARETEKAGHDA